MVSNHNYLSGTIPYSYPLTPPVSVYGHPSWEEVDQKPLCCVHSGGMDQGDDETSLDASIYQTDGGLYSVPSMTASSAFKPVTLDPGPSTYASISQNFTVPSVQPGFVVSQPVVYSTTGPHHAVPAVPAAPASPKGKAKLDMNLAPAGSVAATAGFQTPLAAHVATLAVWIWYSEYDADSLAAVGTRPTIPADLFDIDTDARPINPSQLNPTPAFVGHVAHILKVTMVSHSVMVIALLYIYRLKRTNPIVAGPGSEFRPFIASLILSNKFLDDNTYTNKTWSELTQLSVKEIGDMEIEFLNGLNYSLKVEHSEYVHWRHVLDGFMLANQRIRRPVPFAYPQQSISPAQPLAHLLSPVPALSLQSLPRAQSASPAYPGSVQLPPMGAYVFPPASPTHARKRSAEAAFVDTGAPPTSSAIYEAMRHSARKAVANVDPSQWVPATVANTPDSNASGSVKRASSLNRKIARLPAEGGSRRGSHSHPNMSQSSVGTINLAAMTAPVMANQFTWRQMQRTGPDAYQALITPCVAPQPVYLPPEHMVYYELAATPHLGPDGQFRKARMRYQANPHPSAAVNPLQPINPNTYGMQQASIVPAAPAPTPANGSTNPAMSLAPTPASSSALMFDPYAGQLAPYTIPLQDASSYSQPVPGQFANAGPPGWMYDPSLQAHTSVQSAQWGNVARNGSDMALSTSSLQLQLQQYQQQQQKQQHQQVPMTASAAYHPNRLSTGSEELFGLDNTGMNMSAADVDSAWRTRSEWSSPMPGWGGQPHDWEGYRQAAYTHQAPSQ